MRRRAGMTIVEIMIAATLLVVLTGVLLQLLVPILRNATRMDEKQDNLQKLIILREDLLHRLKAGKVKAVSELAIEFYAPDLVDTGLGPLPRIDTSEIEAFDETHVHEIVTETDGTLVHQVRHQPHTRQVLWALGPGGAATFDGSRLPLLGVSIRTRAGEIERTTSVWERSFDLMLEHYVEPPKKVP